MNEENEYFSGSRTRVISNQSKMLGLFYKELLKSDIPEDLAKTLVSQCYAESLKRVSTRQDMTRLLQDVQTQFRRLSQ